jgi:urease accessory protein
MAADAPRGFEAYAGEEVPQAAVGSPGKEGELDLAFATGADGGTHLVRDYARVPFHVSGSLDHAPPEEGTAVYVQSPTGGVAQGDRHEVSIDAGPGATALVSTGSATKVQSMEHNYARAEFDLSVGEGGHLEYVPERTILYPDARYAVSMSVDLALDSTAIVGEVIVPGRLARGEAFGFERYGSRIEARGPEGRLFEDAVGIDPGKDDPGAMGVLGEHDVFAMLYVVSTTDLDPRELADAVHERVTDQRPAAGASVLPDESGVWVRVAGEQTEPVADLLHVAWDEARRTLIDAPVPDMRRY